MFADAQPEQDAVTVAIGPQASQIPVALIRPSADCHNGFAARVHPTVRIDHGMGAANVHEFFEVQHD